MPLFADRSRGTPGADPRRANTKPRAPRAQQAARFAAMANTLQPYVNCIRHTLDAALCLRNFPSQVVERHNKPEVEVRCVDTLLPWIASLTFRFAYSG